MEFINENYPTYNFYLHLVSDIKDGEFLDSVENDQKYENILFLNPDYVSTKYMFIIILDYFHLSYYTSCA